MFRTIITGLRRRVGRRLLKEIRRAEAEDRARRNKTLLSRMEKVGTGAMFHGRAHVTSPKNVVLGQNVHIGDNAFIRAEGGLSVGDNTHISRNLVLYTINHQMQGARLPYDETYEHKPVGIGKNVWIGMNVCIAPGTTIGDGAIIGMGTTVAGTVAPLSIVVGPKWRMVGQRDSAHYQQLEDEGLYGGINGHLFKRT